MHSTSAWQNLLPPDDRYPACWKEQPNAEKCAYTPASRCGLCKAACWNGGSARCIHMSVAPQARLATRRLAAQLPQYNSQPTLTLFSLGVLLCFWKITRSRTDSPIQPLLNDT